jgi:hypothetical protein
VFGDTFRRPRNLVETAAPPFVVLLNSSSFKQCMEVIAALQGLPAWTNEPID